MSARGIYGLYQKEEKENYYILIHPLSLMFVRCPLLYHNLIYAIHFHLYTKKAIEEEDEAIQGSVYKCIFLSNCSNPKNDYYPGKARTYKDEIESKV